MQFEALIKQVEKALRGPLPGATAQALMAPRPRGEWPAGFAPERARQAAGLLLLAPRGSLAHVILTERAHTLDRHGGQISMPGGVVEPGEASEQAALREAQEEIGLDPRHVRTLGALTPIDIPVSGFRLHPVLGVAQTLPPLAPAADEVSRIFTVPVSALLDPGRVVWRSMARRDLRIDFPVFPIEDAEIWGATAMVLAEFLALIGWSGPGDRPELRDS